MSGVWEHSKSSPYKLTEICFSAENFSLWKVLQNAVLSDDARETYSYWSLQYSYILTHHFYFYDSFLKQHFNKYFKKTRHGYLSATMIIRAKYWNNPKCQINREPEKHTMIQLHNAINITTLMRRDRKQTASMLCTKEESNGFSAVNTFYAVCLGCQRWRFSVHCSWCTGFTRQCDWIV